MPLIATCPICSHSQAALIDAALLAGEPSRLLVQQYGVTLRDVARHKRAHLLTERGRPMTPLEGAPKPAALGKGRR